MACDPLRHEPELLGQGMENKLCSSENIIIHINESTAMLSDVTSDAEDIPNASDNGSATICFCSGKLFTIVTKVTGLWNVQHKGYASLCALFVLLNILFVVAEILTLTFCGPLLHSCLSKSPLNSNETNNRSGPTGEVQALLKYYKIDNVTLCCYGFASTVTLILLIFSLHKLSKELTGFSPSAAQTGVSSKEWLLINVVLIVWAVVFVGAVGTTAYAVSLLESQKTGLLITFCLGLFINFTATFICVVIFAVVSCALGHLVSACFEDIKSIADGNLSDIITMHQQLRQRIFIASDCFKVWFVVHWTMFGAICLSSFAFFTLEHSIFLHFNPFEFGVVAFACCVVIFVVPCVYASRITWQCNNLLFMVNCTRLEDWSENHPFRDRATLNEFIFYAERSQSGFRLGNFTFGSTGALVSVFLGLIGLVLNLVSFIKKEG